MSVRFSDEEFVKLKRLLHVFDWAQQMAMTKFRIMQQDILLSQDRNPIEHIKARLKAPEAIAQKLQKLGLEITADNVKVRLTDVAGIRMICPFAKDIYRLVNILREMSGLRIVEEEDYISNPKKSGYRSYHLIVMIPIHHAGKTEEIPVEIQIRTAAMDFWATMEHQVRYKYKEHIPQHLSDELVMCSNKVAELDERMLLIQEIISLINEGNSVDDDLNIIETVNE
ncbi:MAG: GTP pyrophosphokinase family protein [Oscillospiraceae bacterium]|nr:GTP pyrophosphokinase family protein [Oscillospiraceae bacterium]